MAKSSEQINSLLDRVFDEYGLIICGWSAVWDIALRESIRRSPNRRFSLWWTTQGILSEEARDLVSFRRGSTIEISSADDFFSDICQKVTTLEELNSPHPLSAAIAVASLKKFLVEDRYRIQLEELVLKEIDRLIDLYSQLSTTPKIECEDYLERIRFYDSTLEIARSIIVNACYWGKTEQNKIWLKAIVRIADSSTIKHQNAHTLNQLQR